MLEKKNPHKERQAKKQSALMILLAQETTFFFQVYKPSKSFSSY